MGPREISRSLSISPATASNYINAVREADLSYSRIAGMDEEELKRIIKGDKSGDKQSSRPQPNWEEIYGELKKKGVTLQLLWEEYKQVYPDGYQSTQFCDHYRKWKGKLNPSLRQTHKAGEKMFVDYAGQTVPVTDRYSGRIRQAEIFVAALGASNYTYSEATWSQSLSNWIDSHIHTFEYFGGVTRITVPDNIRTGISKACRYEPDINPTYHDMAIHYGTVIIPTRVRKPKDKAKVENAVLVVERWILAALRNRTFFSLEELNRAIVELLVKLNNRPFKKLPGSRSSWFEEIDRPALLPLPQDRYVLAEWKQAKVNIDYHVELLRHYYSVPYQLIHETLRIRYTTHTVEIFHKNKRIASHRRDDSPGRHTTCAEHMPNSHQKYLEWSPSRIIRWGKTVGSSTARLMETIMDSREHPEQGYRSCMGIMRLGKPYSKERLEAACARAIVIGATSYRSVRSILEKGLDKLPLPGSEEEPTAPVHHQNIRGTDYYH
jgi:transposase